MPDPTSTLSPDFSRGKRGKIPSVLLKDFVTHYVVTESPSLPASSSSSTPYHIAHYINCTNFSKKYRKFLAFVISHTEHMYFKEAMKDDG